MPFDLFPKQYEALDLLKSDKSRVLLAGGARSTKTFVIMYYILSKAIKYPGSRQLICRLHLSDLKGAIINDTLYPLAKMWSQSLYNMIRKGLNKQEWNLEFPNGSQIWFSGLGNEDQVEKVLGREFCTIFFNEAPQIDYETYQKVTTRLSQNIEGCSAKLLFDCNPTTIGSWIYKLFIAHIDPIDDEPKDPSLYGSMRMHPKDNLSLSPDYIKNILEQLSYRGRQRFLDGIWAEEIQGALWTRDIIDPYRSPAPAQFDKIVVGVDPATTKNKDSDETGIVVVGKAGEHGYVLGDYSGKYTPQEWAAKAIWAYEYHQANHIAVETNNGGLMVIDTLKNQNKYVPIKGVRAAHGKIARAEPIAALYEQGKGHHTKKFIKLESQMMTWTGEIHESPDRLDALVWAWYSLFIKKLEFYIMPSKTGSGFSV